MKKLLLLSLCLALLNCKTSNTNTSKNTQTTAEELKTTVSYLASNDLKGRKTGTEGIDKASTFIENKLKEHGVSPYFETYRDSFKIGQMDAFNVVGVLEGNGPQKDEVVLIGAHYDHIGFGKTVETDSIANGANDNATGTASVLALAKYFGAKKRNNRTLVFALFSAEEMGLLGSKHLAEKLKNKGVNLYAMLNLEMVGVPLDGKTFQAFITGYDKSNLAGKLNEYANAHLIGFSEVSKKYQLFKRSDNYPFFQQFNVPCHTISSCDLTNFDYYHHVKDETALVDFQFMTSLVNALAPAIESLVNSEPKELQLYEN